MLSIASVSASAGTSYFEKGTDDYYFKNGNGTDLNTGEKIDLEKFTKPVNERIQTTGGDTKGKDKIAEDLTFSAPKSVSVIAALGNKETRENMFSAHDKAVKNVMNYIKDSNMVRANEHGNKEGGLADKDSISLAKFNHFTNRNQDPQLHSHVLIANAVKNMDGKLASTNLKEIYQNQKNLGVLYRQELAKELEKKDYKIEWDKDGKGTFELKGFTKEQLQDFSTRRAEIKQELAKLEKKGLDTDSAKVKELATLETRKAKENVDPEKLEEIWQETAKAAGINIDSVIEQAKAKEQGTKDIQDVQQQEKELVKEYAVKEAVEEQISTSGFMSNLNSELNLVKSLAEKGITVDINEVRDMLNKEYGERKDLNHLYENKFGINYVTDNNTMNAFIKNMQNPVRENQFALNKDKVEKNFENFNQKLENEKGFKLDESQSSLVKNIATSEKDFTVLGKAGAGKTTMMEALKEIYQKQNLGIMGVSVSGAAAMNLEKETGIKSHTIDSLAFKSEKFLESMKNSGKQLGLIIVDEAGMLDAKRVAAIREFADKANAKILYVGDTEQLKPIGAGDPFKDIVRNAANKGSFGELTEIYRQSNENYKDAVLSSAFGKNKEAFEKFDKLGWIQRIGSKNERFEAIRKEYLDNVKQGKDTIVVAGKNNDVNRLNREIKYDLQKEGVVDSNVGLKVETKDGSGKGLGEKIFNINDKIMFLKNDNKLGVKNGMTGTVTGINQEKGILTVNTKFGEKTIDTQKYNSLNYGYAMTVHKSQGQTVDKVIYAAEHKNANANLFYVAVSRGREKASIYLDSKQEQKFKEKIAEGQEKTNPVGMKSFGLDKSGKEHKKYINGLEQGKNSTIAIFTDSDSYNKYSAQNDLKQGLAEKGKRDTILYDSEIRQEVAEKLSKGNTNFSKTSEKIANIENEKGNYKPEVNNELKYEIDKSFNKNEMKKAIEAKYAVSKPVRLLGLKEKVQESVRNPNPQAYKDAFKPTILEKMDIAANTVKNGLNKIDNKLEGVKRVIDRESKSLTKPFLKIYKEDFKNSVKSGVSKMQEKVYAHFAKQGKFERAYLAGTVLGMDTNKLEGLNLAAQYKAGKIGIDKVEKIANSHLARLFNPGTHTAAKHIAEQEKAKREAQLKFGRRNQRHLNKAGVNIDKFLSKREKLMSKYFNTFYDKHKDVKKLHKLQEKINKLDTKITREATKASVLSRNASHMPMLTVDKQNKSIVNRDEMYRKAVFKKIDKHLEKMDKLQEKYRDRFSNSDKKQSDQVKNKLEEQKATIGKNKPQENKEQVNKDKQQELQNPNKDLRDKLDNIDKVTDSAKNAKDKEHAQEQKQQEQQDIQQQDKQQHPENRHQQQEQEQKTEQDKQQQQEQEEQQRERER